MGLPPWLPIAAVVAITVACSPYTSRGSSLYWEGRYIEAAEAFERTERRLPESPPRQRAEYALFRGLTFLELGDLPGARQWLSYAYTVERQTPGTLSGDERNMLNGAWGECEQRTRAAPSPVGVESAFVPR